MMVNRGEILGRGHQGLWIEGGLCLSLSHQRLCLSLSHTEPNCVCVRARAKPALWSPRHQEYIISKRKNAEIPKNWTLIFPQKCCSTAPNLFLLGCHTLNASTKVEFCFVYMNHHHFNISVCLPWYVTLLFWLGTFWPRWLVGRRLTNLWQVKNIFYCL